MMAKSFRKEIGRKVCFAAIGCRKSGLRHFFEVFIAPLRLRRGQGAMQGNPCYARLFADLTRMSPNPIIASGAAAPEPPGVSRQAETCITMQVFIGRNLCYYVYNNIVSLRILLCDSLLR